jgi:hypothetical protein
MLWEIPWSARADCQVYMSLSFCGAVIFMLQGWAAFNISIVLQTLKKSLDPQVLLSVGLFQQYHLALLEVRVCHCMHPEFHSKRSNSYTSRVSWIRHSIFIFFVLSAFKSTNFSFCMKKMKKKEYWRKKKTDRKMRMIKI